MTRSIYRSPNSGFTLSHSVSVNLNRGDTGRELQYGAAEKLAKSWYEQTNWDSLTNHQAASKFRQLILTANILEDDHIVLYRGANIPLSEIRPPKIDRMGPNPKPQGFGRYHREGERALYLSESQDGVYRELKSDCIATAPYVIRVKIPLTAMRIANFANLPDDCFINAVFDFAERCSLPARGSKLYDYTFSQVVGSFVREQYDGMIVPGVRGERGSHYKNVVLFNNLDQWHLWTDNSPPPSRYITHVHDQITLASFYIWEMAKAKDVNQEHGHHQSHFFQAIDEFP